MYINMVKDVLSFTALVLVNFKDKLMTQKLKFIILFEIVQIWIYIM